MKIELPKNEHAAVNIKITDKDGNFLGIIGFANYETRNPRLYIPKEQDMKLTVSDENGNAIVDENYT